jgi:predicted site-specific integrase-resolvase
MELVTRKVAAYRAGVSIGMLHHWCKKGFVKKHYVLNHKQQYLVDLEEVMEQHELGYQRKHKLYNVNWHLQVRGENGRYVSEVKK